MTVPLPPTDAPTTSASTAAQPSRAGSPSQASRPADARARERRANLIFLLILVVAVLPGTVIVLAKAIRGTATRPLVPPPLRSQFAYMDTTPQLRGLPRVTPPATGGFVAQTTNRLTQLVPGMRSLVAQGDFRAIMSDKLSVQLVAIGPQDGSYFLGLIGWHPKYAPIPSLFTLTAARADGSTATGELNAYESANIPLDIRDELQRYGFIIPPDGIQWMIVRVPGTEPVTSLTVDYNGNGVHVIDTLIVPANVDSYFSSVAK